MIPHQHLRLPRRRHEYRVDTAAYRRSENVADLQTNEERKSHHNYLYQVSMY